MRQALQGVAVLVLLAALAVVLAIAGSNLHQALSPERLAGMERLVAVIWWPTTAVRCAVYAGLAWWVFPVRVARRLPARDAARRERVRRRAPAVFAGLLGGELLIAQLPFWLIHG